MIVKFLDHVSQDRERIHIIQLFIDSKPAEFKQHITEHCKNQLLQYASVLQGRNI